MQTPKQGLKLQTGQRLMQELIQKQIVVRPPKILPPKQLPRRPPRIPAFRIPEMEKLRTRRGREEAKDKQSFIGNVLESDVSAAGFKGFTIKYGEKKVSKQAAINRALTGQGRKGFSERKWAKIISRDGGRYFTEKKPKAPSFGKQKRPRF